MSLVRRESLILWIAGTVASALVVPYQLSLVNRPLPLPLPVVAVAAVVQTGILLALAVAAGLWFARRTGLGAPLLEAALLVSLAILVLDALRSQAGQALTSRVGQLPSPSPWTGVLAAFYGGIAEELLTRLFLLSLIAWTLRRVIRGDAAYWIAIVAAAVLFGLAHLPATGAIFGLTPLVVVRAIVLNGIPGVAFGVLYWRYGLESAMLSHFATDIVLHAIVPAVLRLTT